MLVQANCIFHDVDGKTASSFNLTVTPQILWGLVILVQCQQSNMLDLNANCSNLSLSFLFCWINVIKGQHPIFIFIPTAVSLIQYMALWASQNLPDQSASRRMSRLKWLTARHYPIEHIKQTSLTHKSKKIYIPLTNICTHYKCIDFANRHYHLRTNDVSNCKGAHNLYQHSVLCCLKKWLTQFQIG